MEHVRIDIDFAWSVWTPWNVVSAFTKQPARGPIPPRSGVYEIRRVDAANPDECLSIGSARKLTARLYELLGDQGSNRAAQRKQALLDEVGGKTELLVIRWTVVEEYQALEHYLYRQHVQRVGKPPKYSSE